MQHKKSALARPKYSMNVLVYYTIIFVDTPSVIINLNMWSHLLGFWLHTIFPLLNAWAFIGLFTRRLLIIKVILGASPHITTRNECIKAKSSTFMELLGASQS